MFQSPTRDSGRSSASTSFSRNGFSMFQSPTRDSGRSSLWAASCVRRSRSGFNPPLGILAVQASGQNNSSGGIAYVSIPHSGFWPFKPRASQDEQLGLAVSIPHSGFWPFKRWRRNSGRISSRCFNPPLGILAVQAPIPHGWQCPPLPVSIPHSGFWPFKPERLRKTAPSFSRVSIPHSGFWPFKPGIVYAQVGDWQVSIPHSGVWPFKPVAYHARRGSAWACFNPPLGILAVQARRARAVRPPRLGSFNPPLGILAVQATVSQLRSAVVVKFQSPTRDSGRSSSWMTRR